jgi:hypothetical protein
MGRAALPLASVLSDASSPSAHITSSKLLFCAAHDIEPRISPGWALTPTPPPGPGKLLVGACWTSEKEGAQGAQGAQGDPLNLSLSHLTAVSLKTYGQRVNHVHLKRVLHR